MEYIILEVLYAVYPRFSNRLSSTRSNQNYTSGDPVFESLVCDPLNHGASYDPSLEEESDLVGRERGHDGFWPSH